MKRLSDRIKRTGKKPTWKESTEANDSRALDPCLECCYVIPREEHNLGFLLHICTNPKRLIDESRDWTTINHLGEKCQYFEKGRQLRLGEFET